VTGDPLHLVVAPPKRKRREFKEARNKERGSRGKKIEHRRATETSNLRSLEVVFLGGG